MSEKNTDHIYCAKDEHHQDILKCENCGTVQVYKLPMSVDDYVQMSRDFIKLHEDCQPVKAEVRG